MSKSHTAIDDRGMDDAIVAVDHALHFCFCGARGGVYRPGETHDGHAQVMLIEQPPTKQVVTPWRTDSCKPGAINISAS